MKMNRIIALMLAALLLAVVFAGCAREKTPETTKAPETEAADQQDFFWFTLNGTEIHMGVPYAELKEKLGDEAKPSETIEACDPGSDWVQIMHFYPGITVNEDKNGNVFGIELGEYNVGSGDAAINGTLKVGVSTRDDVVSVLGEPEPNEYGMFYNWNGYMLAVYLDEETGLLSSAMVMESDN